jgi:hypothetical protein
MYKAVSVFLLLFASACSTPAIDSKVSAEFAAEGLYPVQNSGFAEAYALPDARLANYRAVDIQVLDVSNVDISNTLIAGTTKRDWAMTPERQAVLQKDWAKATEREFSSYTRTSSGDGVLGIAARLTRMAPGRPTAATLGGEMQPPGSSRDVVEVWVEFRLYDGSDGSLVALIRDNRTMTSISMSRTFPVMMSNMLSSWASLLHTRISGK